MSQSQDMDAINSLFNRSTPKNSTAAALKTSWQIWYGDLGMISRNFSSDVLQEAKLRRDNFNRAQAGKAPVSAAGTVKAAAVIPAGPMPLIKKGSSGEAVKVWQRFVGAEPVDGKFGKETEALSKTWQKKYGLVDDGVIGDLTWTKARAVSNQITNQPTSAAVAAQQAVRIVEAEAKAPPATAATAEAAAKQAAKVIAAAPAKTSVTKAPVKKAGPSTADIAKQAAAMAAGKPAPSATLNLQVPSLESVKDTLIELHNTTPLWLKVTTGALAALTAVLGVEFIKGKKRAA